MRLLRFFARPVLISISFPATIEAQVVTEPWLRLAASACGGGLSVAASGELEALLLSRLKAGGAEVEGKFDLTDVETLLSQFESAEKQFEAKAYRECLLNLMQMAVDNSGMPPREIILESPVAVAPLQVVKRGQRFALTVGESAAIGDPTRIITLKRIDKKDLAVELSWINSDKRTGDNSQFLSLGNGLGLEDECIVTPYAIDEESASTSFISDC